MASRKKQTESKHYLIRLCKTNIVKISISMLLCIILVMYFHFGSETFSTDKIFFRFGADKALGPNYLLVEDGPLGGVGPGLRQLQGGGVLLPRLAEPPVAAVHRPQRRVRLRRLRPQPGPQRRMPPECQGGPPTATAQQPIAGPAFRPGRAFSAGPSPAGGANARPVVYIRRRRFGGGARQRREMHNC